MQVSVELPDVYFSFYDKPALVKEIQLSLALILFKQGKVSISKAANIAGLDLYEFMKECKKNEIPVINISVEELNAEWDSLKAEIPEGIPVLRLVFQSFLSGAIAHFSGERQRLEVISSLMYVNSFGSLSYSLENSSS